MEFAIALKMYLTV